MPDTKPKYEKTNIVIQFFLALFALATLCGGCVMWEKGWINMPDDVKAVREKADASEKAISSDLSPRLKAVEDKQKISDDQTSKLWREIVEQGKTLSAINQSLADVKSSTDETRQDVKNLGHTIIMPNAVNGAAR